MGRLFQGERERDEALDVAAELPQQTEQQLQRISAVGFVVGRRVIKSPATVFWLVLHGLCCLISLVLGFRFSRLVFFFLFSTSSSNLYPVPFRSASELAGTLDLPANPITNLEFTLNRNTTTRELQ
ncbi:putative beta-1 4-xylosyltransferase IRX14H [Prunus yedoensis var. nudiflora]|uniref:Putative beta-1 4-xylosyltransferase IRX14H n=1 Tax=Prunus yedoensis var. nudiflora TaxID=2094558 RepID=A0A314Z1S6_PRUYE|nr:putative beta-1 4-xylosyltransferase IRX14H [Prunus yedoensis var. nudiflora]